jgi:two-component system heavy metal sensor histidine kinase CusS
MIFPRTWPIVRRLTILYAVSACALLAISAGFLDWVLISDMQKDDNQFLAAELQSFRTLLKQRPDSAEAWREEIERETLSSIPGYARYYVRILDESHRTLVETPGMREVVPSSMFPAPLQAYDAYGSGINAIGRDGRSLLLVGQWVEIYQPTTRKLLVQVALDKSHEDAVVRDYRRKVLMVLLFGVLLSTGSGFLVARTGLRPLKEITTAFQGITSDRLHERVGSTAWPKEITALASAFDGMLDRLEQSFGLLSHFSADLAHELRTPINNLRGEAEVALYKSRTTEEYRQVLESSLEEYERLSRMIDSLLFLAHADSRDTAVRLSMVNIRQEVDALLEFYDAVAQEKEIEVSCSGNSVVSADPILFRRAMTNLLSNAFQYTQPGGKIAISVSKGDNRFSEIAVRDTGIGIEEANLPRIFDRFYRTDRARALHPQGAGLGFAIVKSIMEIHGGRVAVESQPGKGTVVTLSFFSA